MGNLSLTMALSKASEIIKEINVNDDIVSIEFHYTGTIKVHLIWSTFETMFPCSVAELKGSCWYCSVILRNINYWSIATKAEYTKYQTRYAKRSELI